MSETDVVTIHSEFEVNKDVWRRLADDLRDKGIMVMAGIYELTPADVVAHLVKTGNTQESGKGEG